MTVLIMPRFSCLLLAAGLGFLPPNTARSQEDPHEDSFAASGFDTEHIFGFAEGSDIGPRGEREIESTNIASFGARGGYFNADTETALRYVITDELRLSAGALTDYFQIPDKQGFNNRNTITLSGATTEARWNLSNWRTAPFGMTLSINPDWRRNDPVFGRSSQNFAAGLGLLIDKEVIPGKFFAVLNLIYEPSFAWPGGHLDREQSFTIIAAGSYAFSQNILAGAEIRHENQVQDGNLGAHALYFGPNIFVRLTEDFTAKLAWAAQIPDAAAHHLDIANYQRHQVDLLLSYNF